jgi:hypothetical protein
LSPSGLPRFNENRRGIHTAPSQLAPQALAFRAQRIDFGAVVQLSMKIQSSIHLFASFHSALWQPQFPMPR